MAKEYMMFFATFCIQAYRCTFCRICWLLLAFVYITRAIFFCQKMVNILFFEGLDQPPGRKKKKFRAAEKSSSQIQKPSHHLAGRRKIGGSSDEKNGFQEVGGRGEKDESWLRIQFFHWQPVRQSWRSATKSSRRSWLLATSLPSWCHKQVATADY